MFGISAFEIISFLKQAGLGLAGASCLWGIYFYIKARGSKGEKTKVMLELSQKMIEPLTVGTLIFISAWTAFEFIYPPIVGAHEGITLVPTVEAARHAFELMLPALILFAVIYLVGGWLAKYKKEFFAKNIHIFYGTEFALAFILISFPVWMGNFNAEQIFFAGHGFHSIFTLGTVLVLDFVFVLSKYSEKLERHIYPILPDISKVIWAGLALDFASIAFVFHDAVAHTPKFLFMQTVIAIVIINGIFLSGPVTEKLINSVKNGVVKPLDSFWQGAATVSGAVSITSWLTVTFVDTLKGVELGYLTLLGLYLAAVFIAYLTYEVLEHYKVGSRW